MSATKKSISIDAFYDSKKNIIDLSGNFIAKDKYPFIDILSTYLNDIVASIDVEIKNSTRNSMINWREKKNPKLLSRFINNDENVNLINRSMNKITAGNYANIANEITDTLMGDSLRKIPDYAKYLFDSVIKKCIADENFIADYVQFMMAFNGIINKNIIHCINQFVSEVNKLANIKESFKDVGYFSYVKDVVYFKHIGIIYGNIFLLSNKNSNSDDIEINQTNINDTMKSLMRIILINLDWLPANIDELSSRLYLMIGIIESIGKYIWHSVDEQCRTTMNDILNQSYKLSVVPNKIKFKILDVQDMIKNIGVTPPQLPILISSSNSVHTISHQESTIVIDTPSKDTPSKDTSSNNNISVNPKIEITKDVSISVAISNSQPIENKESNEPNESNEQKIYRPRKMTLLTTLNKNDTYSNTSGNTTNEKDTTGIYSIKHKVKNYGASNSNNNHNHNQGHYNHNSSGYSNSHGNRKYNEHTNLRTGSINSKSTYSTYPNQKKDETPKRINMFSGLDIYDNE